MAKDYCKASSDDLNCYEFTGGFHCHREIGHDGYHQSEVDTVSFGETVNTTKIIMWGEMTCFPPDDTYGKVKQWYVNNRDGMKGIERAVCIRLLMHLNHLMTKTHE